VKSLSQPLTAHERLRTYGGVRTLEARARAIEDLLDALRQRCLHGGPAVTALTASSELRWQARQLELEVQELQATLGAGRRRLPPAKERVTPPEPPSMRGTTDVFSVAELVGLLSALHRSGTLTLQTDDSMFVFEFREGAIVHAVTNHANPDLRLGTILVAANKLTEQQLEHSLAATEDGTELLGARLVRTNTVSDDDLRAALEVQVQRIFTEAFALQHARFTFFAGSVSDIALRVTSNTTRLLLEAARQQDEAAAGLDQP
jgi:hypothetical protein